MEPFGKFTGDFAAVPRPAIAVFAVSSVVALCCGSLAHAQVAQTDLAALVRHAPNLNGTGLIEGSLHQLLGESATLNGGFKLTGDWLVPGTPTVRVNGHPHFAGTVPGSCSASPTGYQITLNGNCSLHFLRTRTAPVSLPTCHREFNRDNTTRKESQ